MPSLSHPDLAVSTADGLEVNVNDVVLGNDAINDQEVAEEQELFQDSSSDTSGISDPSIVPSETGELLFSPALYLQRYQAVLDYLSAFSIQSVLDTGCNNCRFMKFLQNLPGVNLVAGLDIDKGLLEQEARYLAPLPADWLHGREEEMVVEVWWGSAGDSDSAKIMTGRVQGVTSIELIEHLDPGTLDKFPLTVLGVIKPQVWVVSTPNREYNSLFPDWVGPFRHWDHRFEWDREEFRDWALTVVNQFTEYEVEFGGVGFTVGCEESHGPASQIAVFRRKDEVKKEAIMLMNGDSAWEKLTSFTFPKKVDERTKEHKIYDEVMYYARIMAMDVREKAEQWEGSVIVNIEDLLRFDGLKRVTDDVQEIRCVLQERGVQLDKDSIGVVVEADPEEEESDEEWEFSFSDTEANTGCITNENLETEDWG